MNSYMREKSKSALIKKRKVCHTLIHKWHRPFNCLGKEKVNTGSGDFGIALFFQRFQKMDVISS